MKAIIERVRKDGTRTYLARPHVNGRRLKAKTFLDPDLARDYVRAMQANGKRGVFTRETCDSYARRWLTEHTIVKAGPTRNRQKKTETINTYRNDLKPFLDEFRDVRLGDVRRKQARDFAKKHPRAAVVARNVFSDAIEDELVTSNPFAKMNLPQSPGRKDHDPLREYEAHDLAETAYLVAGPYAPMLHGFTLFTFYAGHRCWEGLTQDWKDIRPSEEEIYIPEENAKFNKARTVVLLPEAWEAIKDMPSRPANGKLLLGRRGKPYSNKTGFYWAWQETRAAFWAKLSESRREEIVNLSWHSLRHACGYHFHVTLGLSAGLTAVQLGHEGPELVQELYGHFKSGALDRLKAEVKVARAMAQQVESVR